MSNENVKVRIVEACVVAVPGQETKHTKVGDEISVPIETALELAGSGRAVMVKAKKDDVKKDDK